MGIETIIDTMSRREQLAAMQLLWERLAFSADGTEPPQWHGDVLADRRAAVENGTAKFVDWADAKKRLRERHG